MITTSLNFTSLDPNTFKALLEDKKGTLIDIRIPSEYEQDKITNAINLDFYSSNFEDKLLEFERDLPYFLYCRTGTHTRSVLETMQKVGFKEVYGLKGGLLAWEIMGLG